MEIKKKSQNINIFSLNTKKEAVLGAQQKLSSKLLLLSQNSTPVLLLLSGGSAFQLLNNIPASELSPSLTITVLDERYSTDPTVNNFSQFMQTPLYSNASLAKCSFIDTRQKLGEKQEELAGRFETALRNWVNNHKNGKIIITQGIGADGHTSGILPFPENKKLFINNFSNPDHWVKSYDANGKNPYPYRVTTTLTFLKKVDISILLVCGTDKENALRKTLLPYLPDYIDEESSLAQTPARIIKDMRKVFLFTDLIL